MMALKGWFYLMYCISSEDTCALAELLDEVDYKY